MTAAQSLINFRQSETSTAALIFVHGFTGHIQETWQQFPDFLLKERDIDNWDIFAFGYPSKRIRWFALKRLWSADPGLSKISDSLRAQVEFTFDHYEKLAFVAHSMGGLIVQRAILDSEDLRRKLRCFAQFGTPSNGLVKAEIGVALGYKKQQAKDMRTGSGFISRLRNDWNAAFKVTDVPFYFRTVAGLEDEFVETYSSTGPFHENFRAIIPGNHLSLIKPDSASHLAVQIVVKGLKQKKTAPASPKRKMPDDDESHEPHPRRPDPNLSEPTCTDFPHVNLDSMPVTGPDLFGRDAELALLDEAWENPATKLLVFVAMGGVGKTSLVNAWLHNHMAQDNFRGAERVYAWSFYSQGAAEGRQASADRFMADALKRFNDPNPDEGAPAEKGRRLADLIKKQKTLLVLDGLEPVQHPPGPQEGKIKDDGLRTLLRNLASQNPGLCVITTRLKVDDLRVYLNSSSVSQKELDHLSDEAGVKLLGHLGTTGPEAEMRKAVQEFGGHALALTLLGTYLKTVYGGDVRKRDKIERLIYEDDRQGKHARWIMESYEKWLEGTEKGRRQLAILRIMGLFDRPAEKGATDAVLADPPIEGLTEELQGISEADWAFAVADLRALRLLLKQDACEKESALDCHPLIREHFSEKLKNEKPEAWKEAHSRLYDYFKKLPEKELPDTLEEMEPLFAAVAHGCMAGRHQEAWDDIYSKRISRQQGYSVKKLGAFGADLVAVSNFFETLWTEPVNGLVDRVQAVVLNRAGFHLLALGRLREAAQPMQTGLEVSIQMKNWQEAARDAVNLSEIHQTIGHVERAINYGMQGVEFAKRSGTWREHISSTTTLANAQYQTGKLHEAEALFREAEAKQKQVEPAYFLYSQRGFQFCDLLLSLGQYKNVVVRAKHALEIATQTDLPLFSIALDNLSLGRVYLLQALAKNRDDFTHAETFLNRAVAGLREAGRQDYLPRGLLARAALFRAKKEFENAHTDLNEAHEIAEYGEMKLHLTDYHLEACRLCLAENKPDAAKKHLQNAKDLIRETAYNRRLKDAEELERAVNA